MSAFFAVIYIVGQFVVAVGPFTEGECRARTEPRVTIGRVDLETRCELGPRAVQG